MNRPTRAASVSLGIAAFSVLCLVVVDGWIPGVLTPPRHATPPAALESAFRRATAELAARATRVQSRTDVTRSLLGGGIAVNRLALFSAARQTLEGAPSGCWSALADPAGTVQWQQRDMRDLPWKDGFDAAFCVGNSFGYLDDEGNAAFLRAVGSALKPGAPFLLDTPMVVESLLRTIKDRFWVKAGGVYLLISNSYDHTRGRLDIEYTFVSDGRVEVRSGTHRAYTYRQLVELVQASGFTVEPAAPWTLDTHELLLLARRS